jgi:hypothetical protein
MSEQDYDLNCDSIEIKSFSLLCCSVLRNANWTAMSYYCFQRGEVRVLEAANTVAHSLHSFGSMQYGDGTNSTVSTTCCNLCT